MAGFRRDGHKCGCHSKACVIASICVVTAQGLIQGVDGVASHPPWMDMQLLRHAKHYITEIIY